MIRTDLTSLLQQQQEEPQPPAKEMKKEDKFEVIKKVLSTKTNLTNRQESAPRRRHGALDSIRGFKTGSVANNTMTKDYTFDNTAQQKKLKEYQSETLIASPNINHRY